MLTVKEYAAKKGVSHQAVYKQLQTHFEELEPYIVIQGRTRFLTDEAVSILEKYRDTNIQIVERTNDKELIEELKKNIEMLLQEKVALSVELKEVYKKQAEQAVMLAQADTNLQLLEQQREDNQSLRDALTDLKVAQERIIEESVVAAEQKVKEELQEQFEVEMEEIKRLYQEELEVERGRKLTWRERLFGKKVEG